MKKRGSYTKRPPKYRAVKTIVDGIRFDSKKEAARYQELKFLLLGGSITHLFLQQRFDFVVNAVKIGFYKADFVYFDKDKGVEVVEDVKGAKTPVYNLKKRLMLAIHGIKIFET